MFPLLPTNGAMCGGTCERVCGGCLGDSGKAWEVFVG